MDVVLGIVAHQLLTVAAVAGTGTVLQHRAIDVAYRLNGFIGRRQVGLTNIQMIYVYSTLFGRIGQRSQLADGRSGHLHSPYRDVWHNSNQLFVRI